MADQPHFRSSSNRIFHLYFYLSIFYFSCGVAKSVNARNLEEAKYVLLGISLDPNSPIRTTSNAMIESLQANVSSVRSTGEAFAVRLRTQETNKEPPEGDVKFAEMNDTFGTADYVLWGSSGGGGKLTGGVDLKSSSEWDGDTPHATYPNNYANFKDMCGISGAFVGVRGDQIRCIGNAESCKGTDTITGTDLVVPKKKVFCTDQKLAVVELLYAFPPGATGTFLKLIGVDSLTNFPTDAVFLGKWRAVQRDQVVDVLATSVGVAVLLNDRTVLSWKAGTPYLPSDGNYVRFANKIVANKIGFVARLDTGKVTTWGEGIELDNIPRDITESGSETVADVYAYEECFVAKTKKNAIYTWGVGEVSYCHQSGAHTEGFTPFSSVKDALSKDVETVVGNEKSLVAVKTDGSIVTWGKNDYGGSSGTVPASELKLGIPETLVAIRDGYAITRLDGRTICWGGVTSSYTGAIDIGLSDSSSVIAASNRMFALISKYKGSDLIAWTGADQGIYSSDKEKPTANFALPFTPRRLISSSGGIVVVIGNDCTYGAWSEFGECDNSCGPGIKTRSRQISMYAINGDCTFKTSDRVVCNLGPCEVTEEQTKTQLSTGFIVAIAASGGVILLLSAGGLYVCLKKRTPEDQDYYGGGGGYGGYGGQHNGGGYAGGYGGRGGANDWTY